MKFAFTIALLCSVASVCFGQKQLEFMKQIAERLDTAHIRYMLTGSMAMAIYSVPRMTRDIDLVIE